MEAKIFEVINRSNAKFVYLKDEKKLVSMKLAMTTYYLDVPKVEQTFILGGDEGKTHCLSTDGEYYCSEAAFKAGASLSKEQVTQPHKLTDIMSWLFRSYLVHTDETGAFVWVYENGQATKWRVEERCEKVVVNHIQDIIKCGIELPEAYCDPEEVYKYNDYIVQEKAGECFVREGVYRRLMLTDEQNELVDKLQAVIDECGKAGIAINFNYAENTVTCFNRKNIKDYGWNPSCDQDKETAYQLDLSRAGRCLNGIGDINTEESDVEFVIENPESDK